MYNFNDQQHLTFTTETLSFQRVTFHWLQLTIIMAKTIFKTTMQEKSLWQQRLAAFVGRKFDSDKAFRSFSQLKIRMTRFNWRVRLWHGCIVILVWFSFTLNYVKLTKIFWVISHCWNDHSSIQENRERKYPPQQTYKESFQYEQRVRQWAAKDFIFSNDSTGEQGKWEIATCYPHHNSSFSKPVLFVFLL